MSIFNGPPEAISEGGCQHAYAVEKLHANHIVQIEASVSNTFLFETAQLSRRVTRRSISGIGPSTALPT